MSKVRDTFTIDKEVSESFNKAKGLYSKSALVNYWIKQFLKGNPAFIPKFGGKGNA